MKARTILTTAALSLALGGCSMLFDPPIYEAADTYHTTTGYTKYSANSNLEDAEVVLIGATLPRHEAELSRFLGHYMQDGDTLFLDQLYTGGKFGNLDYLLQYPSPHPELDGLRAANKTVKIIGIYDVYKESSSGTIPVLFETLDAREVLGETGPTDIYTDRLNVYARNLATFFDESTRLWHTIIFNELENQTVYLAVDAQQITKGNLTGRLDDSGIEYFAFIPMGIPIDPLPHAYAPFLCEEENDIMDQLLDQLSQIFSEGSTIQVKTQTLVTVELPDGNVIELDRSLFAQEYQWIMDSNDRYDCLRKKSINQAKQAEYIGTSIATLMESFAEKGLVQGEKYNIVMIRKSFAIMEHPDGELPPGLEDLFPPAQESESTPKLKI